MDRWVGKVAIVTGASAGIGEAIAYNLTKAGMLVVGLGRRSERIETLSAKLKAESAEGKLYAQKCDMTVESDILNAFKWTAENVGNVHVLVNNAGVSPHCNLSEGCTELWRVVLETNVLGLSVATRETVKSMKANKVEGHIIHLNSIAGQYNCYHPTIGMYGASKHAITNLTEILRQEMIANKTNILVTSISPGMVNTDILRKDGVNDVIEKALAESLMLEPEDIADVVIYVLGRPKRVQISEITIRPVNSLF